jgi:hypothetical protein
MSPEDIPFARLRQRLPDLGFRERMIDGKYLHCLDGPHQNEQALLIRGRPRAAPGDPGCPPHPASR